MNKIFHDLRFTNLGSYNYKGKICDLSYVVIGPYDNTRIYYHGIKESSSFDFIVVDFMQATLGKNYWEDPTSELEVEVVMTGEALFDGIRHMTTGDVDNHGYSYYPDSAKMISIWTELRKLETEYCMEGEF